MLAWARRRPVAAAGLFLFLLLFLEFPGVVLLRQLPFVSEMAAGSDLWDFNYPMRRLLSQGIAHARIPLWTDALNTGFPVHAEGQGGFLYPPNLLLALLPLPASIALSLVAAYLCAGIFLFLYAREIGQSRTASLFAAMLFTFSGFLFGHIRHLNLIACAQWLPLALLLCERYARTRRPAWLLALAPVQALQHLAGHPQTAYYTLLFTGVYLLARLALSPGKPALAEGSRRPAGARLRSVALAALLFAGASSLGAGLAGAQLLPTLELARTTRRHAQRDLRSVTFHTLPLPHLATFVWPFAFGDPGRNTYSFFWPPDGEGPQDAVLFWENSGYIGVVGLALALYAIVALHRRSRWVIGFATAAVVSLVLAMGKQTPLFPLLWRFLPGMAAFRVPSRLLLVTDLSLAVLAGFGLETVRARLAARSPQWALPVLAGLVALSAAELLYYDSRQYALVDARQWLAPPPVARAIGPDRNRFRVHTWHAREEWLEVVHHHNGWQRRPEVMLPLHNTLLPNRNVLHGLSHFACYSGFGFAPKARVEREIEILLQAGSPDAQRLGLRLLGLYNIGYLAAPDDLTPAGASRVAIFPVPGSQPVSLYRIPFALPRAYLCQTATPVRGLKETLVRLLAPGFDPRREVLLDASPDALAHNEGAGAQAPPGTLRWLRREPESLALQVNAPAGAWLVLNDFHYPGWVARIDGRPVPIHRANGIVRAVRVPQGRHRVTFSYEPAAWRRGLAVSGVSLVLLAGAWIACRRKEVLA